MFFGSWLIDAVEGDDPFGFEVEHKSQLVGRRVEITPERIVLWNLWSGKPDTISSAVRRLDQMTSIQTPTPEEQRVGQMSYRFWAINMIGCTYHGKPVESCMPITLAQEASTGRLGLYTNTIGMAFLQPADPSGSTGKGVP